MENGYPGSVFTHCHNAEPSKIGPRKRKREAPCKRGQTKFLQQANHTCKYIGSDELVRVRSKESYSHHCFNLNTTFSDSYDLIASFASRDLLTSLLVTSTILPTWPYTLFAKSGLEDCL